MRKQIQQLVQDHIEVVREFFTENEAKLFDIADLIDARLKGGGKVLVFGNGGSASDASHFVGELVGRFEHERHGLPAISLTADSVNLTAIGNDYGYENVFARQVEALANKKDIVLGISTSGTSKNVIKALEIAPENTLKILLTSERIGSFEKKLETKVDYIIKVPSSSTARIQEVHIMVLHVLAMLIEQRAG